MLLFNIVQDEPPTEPPTTSPTEPEYKLEFIGNGYSTGPNTQDAAPSGATFYTATINFRWTGPDTRNWTASYLLDYSGLVSTPFEQVYINPGSGTVTSDGAVIVLSYRKAQAGFWDESVINAVKIVVDIVDTATDEKLTYIHFVQPWLEFLSS